MQDEVHGIVCDGPTSRRQAVLSVISLRKQRKGQISSRPYVAAASARTRVPGGLVPVPSMLPAVRVVSSDSLPIEVLLVLDCGDVNVA